MMMSQCTILGDNKYILYIKIGSQQYWFILMTNLKEQHFVPCSLVIFRGLKIFGEINCVLYFIYVIKV